ncbi:gas vesicle protein [Actinomadura rubrisoli]|uniref:Gas vesicle protein n=2 Tax=Actinomadura rubrisoli TaxID=2530368 RepID=A0A4R5CBH1_9ACTN|nr:gas vesicle protein [Actinomadura rubrisoli]TDD96735.1 gas vesicle protein [Actinomadura rubrisoli]
MSGPPPGPQSANLADLLERILDKGIVIVGDVRVNLLDIELLTIKLRLLVASVDKAKEMGIDWWEHDPTLSSKARRNEAEQGAGQGNGQVGGGTERDLLEENRLLRERLAALEAGAAQDSGAAGAASAERGGSAERSADGERGAYAERSAGGERGGGS